MACASFPIGLRKQSSSSIGLLQSVHLLYNYACPPPPCSPLHIAAKSGLVKVVKELVNRGADLNARDAEGKEEVLNILIPCPKLIL